MKDSVDNYIVSKLVMIATVGSQVGERRKLPKEEALRLAANHDDVGHSSAVHGR